MRRMSARISIWGSALLSVVAVVLIGMFWHTVEHVHAPNVTDINSPAHLEAFLEREKGLKKAENFKDDFLILVPTGLFIQSVAFVSSTDINFTGYIWQKYPKDFPYDRGFSFPEEVISEQTIIKEAYTDTVLVKGEPHELVGSYFDVTVRESFDYSRYPLDFLNIWLRVWPTDWENSNNILLVPDFSSYADNGEPVFGLDGDLVQGEWDIKRTFFSYQSIEYDTNFGLTGLAKDETYYEFFFNLGAERKFINAFIISLVPLLVVAVLLFSTLMTISNDEAQAQLFGFNTTGVLGTCSALFFLVLLSHVQVRSLFASSGFVYIEYFYLVMYGMILLVALNGYLFSLKKLAGNQLLHKGDNFAAKVSFWPILLWALVLVSWIRL